MEQNITYELQKIGLDENEAAVYLANLELGAASVQKIAQRGRVPRATTYLVLEALVKKGLVATLKEGKKTNYVPQHPSRLADFVKQKEVELAIGQKTVEALVPELERRGQFVEASRPRVRYYEGADSFAAFRRDLLSKRKDQKLVRGIFTMEEISRFAGNMEEFAKKRADEGVASRSLYVSRSGVVLPDYDPKTKRAVRKLNENESPIPADVSIIGNCVGLMPYGEPFRAVIVEDKNIADAMVSIFELAWKGAGLSGKNVTEVDKK